MAMVRDICHPRPMKGAVRMAAALLRWVVGFQTAAKVWDNYSVKSLFNSFFFCLRLISYA